MKFRFCGQFDCPDWVLAEIATLSKITSIKIKLLCQQVVNGILGSPIDFQKIMKLTSGAKYELGDIKGTIAALTFIFTSSAKHGADEESLANELQQLGLPKESTSALCKIYSEEVGHIQKKLKADSLKVNEILKVNWRLDYILWSSMLHSTNDPSVQLSLKVKEHNTDEPKCHSFNVSSNNFASLLHELKQAYSIMEDISAPDSAPGKA